MTMKNIFTTLSIILFLSTISVGQSCPIPNGSFEDWVDITEVFDSTGTLLPAETAVIPENYLSAFRLLIGAFTQVLGGISDADFAADYFGIGRSEDASDGNYAMKLQTNALIPFSDVLSIFECGSELPPTLEIDIKHIGPSADTLALFVTLSDSLTIPLDPADLLAARGFVSTSFAVAGTTPDYTRFSIPITDNENGIAVDSVLLWMIATGEESQVGADEESFFLIDNIHFGELSNNYTPELEQAVKVYPVPFNEKLFIDNENDKLEGKIYDLNGRLIKTLSLDKGISQQDMQDIDISGNYILELFSSEKNQRSTYNIIKE